MSASEQTDSKQFEHGYHRRFGAFFNAIIGNRSVPVFLLKKMYYFRIFFW